LALAIIRSHVSWIVSIMHGMPFFDGRSARRAWLVLGEYIRPNVHPRKSNSPSGTLQMRVFPALTVSFSLPMSLRIQCNASSALPSAQDHEIVGIGHDPTADALPQSSFSHPSTNRRM
jgi:hypothetical protein